MVSDYYILPGQLTQLADGRQGTVQFAGETLFAPGDWVGVVLEEATGKNDGSVQGHRYFHCTPGHGIFVRPTALYILDHITVKQPPLCRPISGPPPSKPSAAAKRVGSRPRTSTTATSSSTSSGASQKKVHDPQVQPANTPIPTASGQALPKKVHDPKAKSLQRPFYAAPAKSVRESVSKMNPSPVLSRSSASTGKLSSQKTELSPTVTQNASVSSAAIDREVEDLKSKIRLMEKKRIEDAEQLKSLDKIKADRDRFEKIIQKLERKYQPYQQTMTDLRTQVKAAETKIEMLEKESAENETLVESAIIGRETAKEAAEGLQAEIDELKSQVESLGLDVEIAKEEMGLLEDSMTKEEKGRHGSRNMQRENKKLKDSLNSLREKSHEDETKLKAQVTELQDDVQELEKVKDEYHITKEKLLESEAKVEDLKIQLDNASTQTEFIEELTEKNLEMTARIDELRKANAELEELKKLDTELEVHSEEERRKLQQTIEYQQELLDGEHRKVAKQEALIDDLEQTVGQYKGLVGELQNELSDMRASQQSTVVEANDITNRSRAIMDLNLKLQASASKTNIKTMDLELRKMEAQESLEHLAIVQQFLPEAYGTDRDSVLTHLRFMRVGFKANLLRDSVRERVAEQGTEARVFFGCEIIGELTWASALVAMFNSFISSCSVPQFGKVEGALYDLEPVERAFNGWIEGVKRGEFDERKCASELKRTKAVMSHLAEIHIPESVQNTADKNQMRILLTETYIENTTTALSHIKTMVSKKLSQLGRDDDAAGISRKSDDLIYWARSGKVVASKIVRAVEGLKARSLSMQAEHAASFELCQDEAEELSLYTQSLGEDLCILLHDESREEPIQYWELKDTIERTTFSYFGKHPDKPADKDVFSIVCSTLRAKISKMTKHLMELHELTTDLTQTVEFERGPAPWTLRAKEVMTSLTISAETEDKIRRLQSALHERASQLAIRDKNLDEASVKIELLEARSRDGALVANRMAELERAVEGAKRREEALAEDLAARAAAFQALEAERDARTRAAAADAKPATTTATAPTLGSAQTAAPGVEVVADLASLRHELEGLRAAVRYLRTDSLRARLLESTRFLSWLAVPLLLRSQPRPYPSAARAREARAVLLALLALVRGARVVDLRALAPAGGNKLAWRPEGRSPRAAVWRQREGWEAVVGWWGALFGEGGRRRR